MINTTNYNFILMVVNGEYKLFPINKRDDVDLSWRNIAICGEAFNISQRHYNTYAYMDMCFIKSKNSMLRELTISV